MYIVLMAGGVGTRFWPRSRASNPKQMLNLIGSRSMLQLTYDRIKNLTTTDRILVITNTDLKEPIQKQLSEIPPENIIAEPFGRNTAPCIGLAASIIKKRASDEEVMVVLPADHQIKETDNFQEIIKAAVAYAPQAGCLITLGVTPRYPETGYGYIQRGEKITTVHNKGIYRVRTFAEKPNYDTAERFLKSGDFFWNSGIFIWTVKAIMAEFEEQQPELAEDLNKLCGRVDTAEMDVAVEDVYAGTKSISIDYGIMEHAKQVCIIESDFNWNDIGSWEAAYNISEKDENGNAVYANRNILLDAKNNYIYSSKKIVAAVDVEDLVVVETDDALLICRKGQSQKVKNVVDTIRRKKLDEFL